MPLFGFHTTPGVSFSRGEAVPVVMYFREKKPAWPSMNTRLAPRKRWRWAEMKVLLRDGCSIHAIRNTSHVWRI